MSFEFYNDSKPLGYTEEVSYRNGIAGQIADIILDIGDIATLNTDVKTSLVAALNLVNSYTGSLSNLTTTAKDNIVNSLNELKTNINDIVAGSVTDGSITDLKLDPNGIRTTVANILTNIGTLSELPTTDKTNLVNSLKEIDTNLDNISLKMSDITAFPSNFGAVGDGIVDDKTALQNCFNSGAKKVNVNKTYLVSGVLTIPSNIEIFGNGKIISNNSAADILAIYGSNTQNLETNNVKISGITLSGGRFGIQVYGEGYAYLPHDIAIENVKTDSTVSGGIFLNSCYKVQVKSCTNKGGVRAVGTKAPIVNPRITKDIIIENCFSSETTQYGYQTYYGENISIIGCVADGSLLTGGDISCVTIDRTNNSIVSGNILKNSPNQQMYVTGVNNVTVQGNVCYGGLYGIQACYNRESGEDAAIKESYYVTIQGNTCLGYSANGILANSIKYSNIIGNTCTGGVNSIKLMSETRTGDSVAMVFTNIVVNGNVSDVQINKANTSTTPITFIGNDVPSVQGVATIDIQIDKNYMRLGSKEIDYFGLIKRENMGDDSSIFNFLLTGTTYKGMIWKYTNGLLNIQDSAGTTIYQMQIGNSTPGNFSIVKAGKGITLKSPDGLTTKTITIDNTGALVLV